MHIRHIKFFCFLLIPLVLCGCQEAPEHNPVVSKNDGSFDISIVQSATESSAPGETVSDEDYNVQNNVTSYTRIQHWEEFSSTDKSVDFCIDIDKKIENPPMPVVEVVPHYLTEADAKRIAEALFGKADFYESEPQLSPIYSRQEIQQKIERWVSYEGDAGAGRAYYETARDKFVQEYTLMMENAPDYNPHAVCQWIFRKSSYYYERDTAKTDHSNDNDEIKVSVRVNDIPYLYYISTRDARDFKLNNIFVYPFDGLSPLSVDTFIFQSQLCQTRKPTDEDIRVIKERAESILAEIELGDWMIDDCYVESFERNDRNEYIVTVNAVPVFEQVSVVRRPQISNLKSTEVYASNYYLTDVTFKFNVDGEIVYFELYSPVDVKSVININVQTLNTDQLLQLAKNHLALTDYHEFDYAAYIGNLGEDLSCSVLISDVEYGLTRVKVPNTDESYYYVPAMFFYGTIQYAGETSGDVYDVEIESRTKFPLLILNAIDGSIINSTNE